jgi:signal transduction histidine kinase/serine phosphatase RsbU (regulator of sigma subunit)
MNEDMFGLRFAFALFLILASTSLSAEEGPTVPGGSIPTLAVTDGFSESNLQGYQQILEDPGGHLSIEEVQSREFTNVAEEIVSRGVVGHTYWIRFRIRNELAEPGHLYLELYYPLLDFVTLYRPGPDGYVASRTGDRLPFDRREIEHRNFLFELHIPPGETQLIYLMVQTEGSMQIPLRLCTPVAFIESDRLTQYGQGLYFGIMLGMLLYNLFLFITVNYRGYFYYVLYILGLGGFQMVYYGYLFAYVMPALPDAVNHSLLFSIAFMLFWGVQFSRTFLNTRRYDPLLDWPLRIIQAFALIGILAGFVLPYALALNFAVFFSVCFVAVIYVAALRRLFHGYRPARYFLFAWTTLLIAILILSLKQYGYIPYSFLTNHAMQIGSAMEVLLLSVALGDRIKSIEQEKKAAQTFAYESLKKAHKIKDEFLYNTSLELREPLEGIVAMSEGLIDLVKPADSRKEKELREGLGVIANTGSIVSGLVNDILDFYRIKNSEIQLDRGSIPVHSLVSVTLDLCRHWASSRDIQLHMDIQEGVPPVYADEVRLRQVLFNLVSNGIKFTDAGSVTVKASRKDSIVEFCIVDTGRGIAPDALEDIFFLFERPDLASRAKRGKGLGLTITRKLIELHGGTIHAESSASGTTMIFTVPVARKPAEETPAVSSRMPAMEPATAQETTAEDGRPTVLLVDGDPIHLRGQQRRLSQAGYNVLGAGNATQARQNIQGRAVDLIILDLYLTPENGYELCRELRKKYSVHELPIIIIGRGRSAAELEAALNSGANDYISRPVDRAELLSRVQFLLELKGSIREKERLVRIEKELDVARSIMESLLPLEMDLPPELDGTILYLPAGTIGGDIYDFHNGEWFNLLIADVTGHGVPAALYASMVKVAHTVAVSDAGATPDDILTSIHTSVRDHLGEHFVTAGYLRIHPEKKILQYSRAGHLPLLVCRRDSKEVIELNPGGRLLGLVDDLRLELAELQLQPGDRILCYTDGIYETMTENGQPLGESELKELALKSMMEGPNQAIGRIVHRLSDLSDVPHQIEDDRTLVLIDVK